MKKKILSVFLSAVLIAIPLCSLPPVSAKILGDPDNDGNISASDALIVLQHSVEKIHITPLMQTYANVDNDKKITANDALLILQMSVKKISTFPRKVDEKELYYDERDAFYGVDGSDFTDKTIKDINDTDELISKFGGSDYIAEDVDLTELDDSGKLIYNRVSKEAEKLGTLHKYDTAEKTTGTLNLGNITMTYSMPTTFSAYDAVPIDYTIYSTDTARPIHIEANAFEEPERYQNEDTLYYDCNLPGKVDVDIKYQGYVTGKNVTTYPKWRTNFDDVLGTQYPSINVSSTEPIYSGTIPKSDRVWFKFTYTNTGNTILDSEGNGAFNFLPKLLKKNPTTGEYSEVAGIDDYMVRLYDYFYPGETGEFWLTFQDSYAGPPIGDYRIVIYSQVRNERETSAWAANYVGGITQCIDTFDFSVKKDATITQPAESTHENLGNIPRNQWLGVYEEFMSSYNTLFNVSSVSDSPTTGTIYVQPASFTKSIAIKLMQGNKQKASIVHIPVNITTDDVTIALNPYNDNYYEKSDGTREPLLATQNMVDMRANVQMGPDVLKTVVNDLRNMQEAGINMLTTCCAFSYNPTQFDCFKYMMDAVRCFGTFTFAGYISYPSNSQLTISNATYANGRVFEKTMTPWGVSGYNEANSIMAKYSYTRYGDLYWKCNTGVIPLAMEDTWGWMTIDHDWRFGMTNDEAISQFTAWLKKAYNNDITKLNKKYGSNYSSFEEIDPRKDGNYESGMDAYCFTNTGGSVYKDWSCATADLDVYRTLARTENYKKIIENSGVPGAKIALRSEGSTWLAGGIKSTTRNQHYRQTFYEQRRNSAIPEILEASDMVYGCSNYGDYAPTSSEVYELTKQASKCGITMLKTSMMTHFRDICINTKYGDSKYVTDYNLASNNLKGANVDTMIALFPYMRALYEGGGIAGVMWHDYYCDGFTTSTQYKELKFYSSKIKEMLETEEGKKWATEFEKTDRSNETTILSKWSYDRNYIEKTISDTPRFCVFTDLYTTNK